MALFALDFDHTIANGQTFNILASAEYHAKRQLSDKELWEKIKHIEPVGGKDKWRDSIRGLFADGHQVCVVSFNRYPAMISQFLKEKVGLTEAEISKITIVSWLPPKPNIANKNEHLSEARHKSGYSGFPNSIVLVDDSAKNTDAATVAGYRAIPADSDGDFFNKIGQLSKELLPSVNRQVSPLYRREPVSSPIVEPKPSTPRP